MKNIILWFIFILFSLATAYIIFVALISIWLGLVHIHQDGCWVPILAGAVSLMISLAFFLRFGKGILKLIKMDDMIGI